MDSWWGPSLRLDSWGRHQPLDQHHDGDVSARRHELLQLPPELFTSQRFKSRWTEPRLRRAPATTVGQSEKQKEVPYARTTKFLFYNLQKATSCRSCPGRKRPRSPRRRGHWFRLDGPQRSPRCLLGYTGSSSRPGDTTPADSPLWAVLNSKAAGNLDFSTVTISAGPRAGSGPWPTMPPGIPLAWTNFQLSPASHKLVDVFGTWISSGQINDVPNTAIGTKPPAPIPGLLDPGVSLFVCSMPGDTGVRPGAVPANFWATSLIFLVDQNTGATIFPSTLTAGSEYNLVAVIGNRGNTDGGNYLPLRDPGSRPPASS